MLIFDNVQAATIIYVFSRAKRYNEPKALKILAQGGSYFELVSFPQREIEYINYCCSFFVSLNYIHRMANSLFLISREHLASPEKPAITAWLLNIE